MSWNITNPTVYVNEDYVATITYTNSNFSFGTIILSLSTTSTTDTETTKFFTLGTTTGVFTVTTSGSPSEELSMVTVGNYLFTVDAVRSVDMSIFSSHQFSINVLPSRLSISNSAVFLNTPYNATITYNSLIPNPSLGDIILSLTDHKTAQATFFTLGTTTFTNGVFTATTTGEVPTSSGNDTFTVYALDNVNTVIHEYIFSIFVEYFHPPPKNAYYNIPYSVSFVSGVDYGIISYQITTSTFGTYPVTNVSSNLSSGIYEYEITIFTPIQNDVGKDYSAQTGIILTINGDQNTRDLTYNIFVNGIVGNLGIAYYDENYTDKVYFVGSSQISSIDYIITNTNTSSTTMQVLTQQNQTTSVGNPQLFSIPITGTPNEEDVKNGITLNIKVISVTLIDNTTSVINVEANFTIDVYGFENPPPTDNVNLGDKYTYTFVFFTDPDDIKVTKPHFLKFTDSTISGTPSLCDEGVHQVVIKAVFGSKNVQHSFDINVIGNPGIQSFIQPWSRERTICSDTSLTESEKTERRNELVFKNISNKLTKNENFARATKGLIKRRSRC